MATGITLAHTRFYPPSASSFPTIVGTNSENPTLTDDTHRGLNFAFGSSPATGDNVRHAVKTAPASSNYDIIARFRATPNGFDYTISGFVISDGTKLITFGITAGEGNGYRFAIDKWNSPTSYAGSIIPSAMSPGREHCEWLKLTIVSGVPAQMSVSHSGKDWVRMFDNSAAVSGFLTYTKIGFGQLLNRNFAQVPVSGGPQQFMDVMYWSDPDITPPV